MFYLTSFANTTRSLMRRWETVSPSQTFYGWLSVRWVGLGDIFISYFPPLLAVQITRQQKNVLSRLNLYLFSQGKQKRITMIRLNGVLFKLWFLLQFKTVYKWVEETIALTYVDKSNWVSVCSKTGFFIFIVRSIASIKIVWYLLWERDVFYFHLFATQPCFSSLCQNFLHKIQDLKSVRKPWLKVLCHFQQQQQEKSSVNFNFWEKFLRKALIFLCFNEYFLDFKPKH